MVDHHIRTGKYPRGRPHLSATCETTETTETTETNSKQRSYQKTYQRKAALMAARKKA